MLKDEKKPRPRPRAKKKAPAKMGRPPHKPTPALRASVSSLVRFGVPHERIAEHIGISYDTMFKYYKKELHTAMLEGHRKVESFLFYAASGMAGEDGVASFSDCLRAAMFYAKTQMRWRETAPLPVDDDLVDVTPSRLIVEVTSAPVKDVE